MHKEQNVSTTDLIFSIIDCPIFTHPVCIFQVKGICLYITVKQAAVTNGLQNLSVTEKHVMVFVTVTYRHKVKQKKMQLFKSNAMPLLV